MRRFVALLTSLLMAPFLAGQTPEPSFDEALLREHQQPVQGPALLDFFRQRTLKAAQVQAFQDAFARLSSTIYAERSRATADLLAMGPAVRPLLLRILDQPPADLETLRRAQQCLSHMPADRENQLALAAARQVARTRPAGAAAVLLDYLPYVASESVRQEAQAALHAVTASDVEAARLLRKVLGDPQPFKRAAAGEALFRSDPAQAAQVAPLLQDPHPQVRFQVALALTEKADAAGLPVLIELLAELPAEQFEIVLDLLTRIAADDAPPPALPGKDSPATVRDAWRGWYAGYRHNLDLANRLRAKELGYTVLTHAGTGLNGQVFEIDAERNVRWQFGGIRYPVDVQVLGPDRVLLAEYLGKRVTERDFQGNVLWERAVNMPIACQRLPGGQTFIAARQMLCVLDRDGKELFTWFRPNTSIVAARRLRSGQTILVTTLGTCLVLDPLGREVKSFRVGQLYTMGSQIDVLPGGRILVPVYGENRVVEYDLEGQVRWQADIAGPTSVSRLANGNTLVVSLREQRVVELSPAGREVWTYQTEGRPWRARRR